MTPEKLKKAFESLKLSKLGDTAFVESKRADPSQYCCELTTTETLAHINFMCDEGVKLIEAGRIEKAMRWLGFIQGTMWALNYHTIDSLKNINRDD